MFYSPADSAAFIARHMEHVSVNLPMIDRLAQSLSERAAENVYDIGKWKRDNLLHPQEMSNAAADWIFVVDSLNFSFWPDSGAEFSIEGEVGYWALCAAINRAVSEGIAITTPSFYSQLTIEQAAHVFRTDQLSVTIPMLEERVQILKQNGRILTEKFGGTFVNCIIEANGNARSLLSIVYNNFVSFRDESVYRGRTVTFLKRAQILIADLWGCFESNQLGRFDDIDQLTMFADYRIPQVLHYFGVLEYSKELMAQLKENVLLPNGNQLEVEIRGASIHAVELLRAKMAQLVNEDNHVPNSIQIDFYLWGYRRDHAQEIDHKSPYHKVRSIFY